MKPIVSPKVSPKGSPKVSIVKCETYDEAEVLKKLRQAIELLGGIGKFIRKGDRVLLKPNLLYGKVPEKAVTTHPSIIRGMIGIVREAGGDPFIGDSPSIGSLMRAAEKAGIKAVAEEMGCPIEEFKDPISPDGKGRFFKQLEVDRRVLEADVVINLPKWKTHGMMLLTLGVKNLFGCVPGTRKALWHLKAGEDRRAFARMLIDLYRTLQPSLTVLDGILGMEGNGPGSGEPISLNLILASPDALSLDQVVCDLVGIPRKALMTNRIAFKEGLGTEEIEVVGERVQDVKIGRFRLPDLSRPDWSIPSFIGRALKNALTSKPVIAEELCKGCNHCEEICPPKALKRAESVSFDYGKCIRCFCCLEVCPEGAISIKPGWLSGLFER